MSQQTAVPEVMSDEETATGVLVEEKDHPEVRKMVQLLALEAETSKDSGNDFVFGLMDEILSAESEEDIFAAQDKGLMSGQDFSNNPFYLAEDNILIKRSTIVGGDGLPFYAMMTVTEIATGEERALNCGGKTFMAVLHALRQIGYFNVTEENPLGRSVVIISTPSPAGAYLSLKPYKVAVPTSSGRGKK